MVRGFLKPATRIGRLSGGRLTGGRGANARRQGRCAALCRPRTLCLLTVVLPVLLLLLQGRPAVSRAWKQLPPEQAAVAAIRCVMWRHTLSCSPYGCASFALVVSGTSRCSARTERAAEQQLWSSIHVCLSSADARPALAALTTYTSCACAQGASSRWRQGVQRPDHAGLRLLRVHRRVDDAPVRRAACETGLPMTRLHRANFRGAKAP